jgi:hypothetical protein
VEIRVLGGLKDVKRRKWLLGEYFFTSAIGAVGNRVGSRSQIMPETDSWKEEEWGDEIDLDGVFSGEEGVGSVSTWVGLAWEATGTIRVSGAVESALGTGGA